MGLVVMIYGKSGSGKSRSMKGFADDEILLVNVQRKALPFRNKFKYVYSPKDDEKGNAVEKIKCALKKMPVKTAVIDDAGYLMTNAFMKGHSQPKSGSSSFDLYNDIADQFWGLLNFIVNDLANNVIVYIVMHEETSDYGETKLKTIGKLLDQKVCLEGMVTICLRCLTNGEQHWFSTQSTGMDISKSPEEMFPKEIDNDLKFVDSTIREYYGMVAEEKDEKAKESA